MTADEIRNAFKAIPSAQSQPIVETQTIEGFLRLQTVVFLQEIAAQLAELNDQLRSVTLKKELTEFVEAFRFARLLLGQDEGKKQ